MKRCTLLLGLGLSSLMVSPAMANPVDFDITINFSGGLTESQKAIFTDAEYFWEDTLVGYAEDIAFSPGLTITASGQNIDGVGQILGSAGPQTASTGSQGTYYATQGQMQFDSADLSSMESNGSLFAVIVHEMAHVIGFGSLWELNNLYSAGTGQYIGPYALAVYQQEFDPNASYVPVELDGGQGTADGHWDENWAGPQSDLLTGYLEGPVTLSQTSLASFRDLGYLLNTAEPESSDVPVPFLGALSLLALLNIRRRS